MAREIHSGELRNEIVFKRPVSSLNDEGGPEITYPGVNDLTAWAKVEKFNQHRTTEAHATTLIGSLDFTVRHTTGRTAITKDWLISYRGEDYIIHEIEELEQKTRFLRFTAKTNG